MFIVTAKEMQEMDREAIESFGIPGRILMENAGREATRFLLEQFRSLPEQKTGIIAGKGNNGGDGFVMARYLSETGTKVTVYLLAEASKVKGDAATNLDLLAQLKIPVIEIPDSKSFKKQQTAFLHQDVLVDAILGTGLQSDVKGYFREVIEFINQSNKPVFAVDIPSGLNADTGQPCGTCVRAKATATFGFAKIGHMVYPGAGLTGNLQIVDIGIPSFITEQTRPGQMLLTPEMIYDIIPKRHPEAHKGDNGHLLVIAGSTGKTGAAAMTAMTAMRSGTGLVTLGIPESLNPILENILLETMTCPLPETKAHNFGEASFDRIMNLLSDKKCLAIGPGIGTEQETRKLLHRIIMESNIPTVIDADGLNNLVGHTDILTNAPAPVILTPHPGEMARLTNLTVQKIQKDRIGCARSFAKKFNAYVVLKGARTIIAHPDGIVFINPTGNPGMASGGMGDVLTGLIAGFVAQGCSPGKAAHAGVYLHGATADSLETNIGPFGYMATDVMEAIPGQIGELLKAKE